MFINVSIYDMKFLSSSELNVTLHGALLLPHFSFYQDQDLNKATEVM